MTPAKGGLNLDHLSTDAPREIGTARRARMRHHQIMGPEERVAIDLTDDERHLLVRALAEWGGPAHSTDSLAVAMGFENTEDLLLEVRRIARSIRTNESLSRRDWRRALIATEFVFASDVFGSGYEWSTTTGLSDEATIRTLRELQHKLARSAKIHQI
ncbi:hypothetical protein [Dactylosporangium sp. NPDC048998]|uniref:hypothetical protein n=1 Tax=Dactylosporangium sp. NPDC048998 TaxID=3363976 RepID=UPI003718999E